MRPGLGGQKVRHSLFGTDEVALALHYRLGEAVIGVDLDAEHQCARRRGGRLCSDPRHSRPRDTEEECLPGRLGWAAAPGNVGARLFGQPAGDLSSRGDRTAAVRHRTRRAGDLSFF